MNDDEVLGLLRVETLAGVAVSVEVIDAAAPSGVRVEAFRGAAHGAVALAAGLAGGLPGMPGGRLTVFRYVRLGWRAGWRAGCLGCRAGD